MKTILKNLFIENVNKNVQNRIYSYYLEKNLKFNKNQINKIFNDNKIKDFTLLFDFYRKKLELTIYSKDQYTINKQNYNKAYYSLDLYLNENKINNFFDFVQTELKKNTENKSNLNFNDIFILKFNKYELHY